MGISGLFSKNSAAPRTDIIWITREAMFSGCPKFLSENKADMYIAWFDDTYEKFNRLLNEENHMNLTITITMAKTLQPYNLDNKRIVFLEHYPLYSKERYLLSGNKPVKVWFINSIDDIIFKLFGGGNIATLMRSLGVEENVYIEHSLITRSIVNAQKKLEKRVRDDFYVRSGEEWLNRYRSFSM